MEPGSTLDVVVPRPLLDAMPVLTGSEHHDVAVAQLGSLGLTDGLQLVAGDVLAGSEP